MGKVKRNIRAKAKSAVAAAKQKAQDVRTKMNEKKEREQQLLTPKKPIRKKEKTMQKRQKLLNRFAELKKERKQHIQSLQNSRAAIIADLKPLRDALPSLDGIYKLVKRQKQEPGAVQDETEKLSAKQKIKKKRTEMVNRTRAFEKVLKDKNFKKNPRQVIRDHMRNKYEQMEEQDGED